MSIILELAVEMDISVAERMLIMSFFSDDSEHAHRKDAVVDILTRMRDTLSAKLANIQAEEEKAKELFDKLVSQRAQEEAKALEASTDALLSISALSHTLSSLTSNDAQPNDNAQPVEPPRRRARTETWS